MVTLGNYETSKLALYIIAQGVRDARSKNPIHNAEARSWLETTGIVWVDILGINDSILDPENLAGRKISF